TRAGSIRPLISRGRDHASGNSRRGGRTSERSRAPRWGHSRAGSALSRSLSPTPRTPNGAGQTPRRRPVRVSSGIGSGISRSRLPRRMPPAGPRTPPGPATRPRSGRNGPGRRRTRSTPAEAPAGSVALAGRLLDAALLRHAGPHDARERQREGEHQDHAEVDPDTRAPEAFEIRIRPPSGLPQPDREHAVDHGHAAAAPRDRG